MDVSLRNRGHPGAGFPETVNFRLKYSNRAVNNCNEAVIVLE